MTLPTSDRRTRFPNGLNSLTATTTTAGLMSAADKSRLDAAITVTDIIADGVTDQSSVISAAIAALPATGGTVLLPATGSTGIAISSTIAITKPNVTIQGVGADMRHNTTPFILNPGTKLVWTGAASGTMVSFTSPSGASNDKMTGGGLRGLVLDGAATAGKCLEIVSWNSGHFDNVVLFDATDACLEFDVVASLRDARDPQENYLHNFTIAARTGSATGLRMKSTTVGANPSYNVLEQFYIFAKDGNAIDLYNCDNNFFRDVRANITGTGNGLVFNGSNSSSSYVARDNIFDHFWTVAPIIARGTSTYTYACGRNAIYNLDRGNAASLPTVETGARLSYSYTDSIQYLVPQIKAIAARTVAQTNSAYDLHGSTSVSQIVISDSDGHFLLTNGNDSVSFVIAVRGSNGNLAFIPRTGAGVLEFGRAAQLKSYTVATLPTGAAGYTAYVTDANATTFASIVAGGGANGVPVYHDGTNWRIG